MTTEENSNYNRFSGHINWKQFIIGILGLLIGTLVYVIDRSPESAYFINKSIVDISLYESLPRIFGRFGYSLPSFFHVFSFSLLTAALFTSEKRTYAIICTVWALIDGLFELGQRYIVSIQSMKELLRDIPFLQNTENYFRLGTFDWFDLLATLLGAILAYTVLVLTMNKKGDIEIVD